MVELAYYNQVEEKERLACISMDSLHLARVTPNVHPRHRVDVAKMPQEHGNGAEKIRLFCFFLYITT